MKAIYAGSFDPITHGHLSIIRSASEIFEELHVVIAKNVDKKYSISLEDRERLIRESIDEIGCGENCTIGVIENDFLVSYAQEHDYEIIVRGLRNQQDFISEKGMKHINDDISNRHVNTMYLIPPRELCEVSSSMVRGLIGFNDWERVARKYVTASVLNYYKKLMDK